MTDLYSQASEIARIMRKWGFEAPEIGEEWSSAYAKILKFLHWADLKLETANVEKEGSS